MKKIYFLFLATFTLLIGLYNQATAQTTITVGTGTGTVASVAHHPYASYFTTSRVQIIIEASELSALGIGSAHGINDIAFQIAAAGTGGASCDPSFSVTNGSVNNLSIGLKNTSATMPIAAYDYAGITNVYTIAAYTPVVGWNKHVFQNSFQWDGVSNLLVDICTANAGTSCTYCYTANSTANVTPTTNNSIFAGWADSQGSWCGSSFPNACNYTPTGSGSVNRPNMQLTFQPLAPPTPPVPNFQFSLGTDTIWEKSNATIINTSVNSVNNYWSISQYSATSATGPFTTYSTLPKDTLQCNVWGCFIDTARNNPNFNYYFPERGYYKVKLTAVNPYGSNFIEKVVFVDTPRSKPTAQFYATRRQVGANDRVKMNNLSSNAPARVKWWLVNNCTTCPADTNRFLPNDSAFSPILAAYTPGTYKVCIAVSNSKGTDTLCKTDYLKILPGYMMAHQETGRFDTVSKDEQGYLYSDLRDASGNNLSGQFRPTNPTPRGFRIAPCADTIYLTLERLRMRNPGAVAGDSIYVRLNGFNGPIVRRWGGNNIAVLKDTNKVYKFAGQQLFITYTPAPTVPLVSLVNDSGFTIRWTSSPAMYNKPTAGFTCPDTLYNGYKVKFINTSSGTRMDFAWDLNNDGAFGMDNPTVGVDSITMNPTITYFTTTASTRKVCLKTANCAGSDTFCRILPIFPITVPPITDFTTNRTSGFINDTFLFIDKTLNGALSWKWRFEPNNVTWLGGTDSTSQFPMVSLNSPQYYNVTLITTNPIGTSQTTKNQIVYAIDYGSPNSAFPPVLDATDFGISRVVINGADKRLDTITPLKSPTYTRMNADLRTTVYRGGSYDIDVYRTTANDAMSLRIWADFNRDADYTDENETVFAEDLAKKVKTSTKLMVPANAAIGMSRILVGACTAISAISSTTANIGVYEDFGMTVGNDLVKPVVKLNGNANVLAELHKTYTDDGATASDNIQGDVTGLIQIINPLNIEQLGTYTIKYFVTDMYGNTSDTVVRNVQVVLNSTGPSLTLFGPDTMQLEVHNTFVEPGYIAISNLGDTLTAQVQRTGIINNMMLSATTLTYTITDAYGLAAQKQRLVKVVDIQSPVVSTFSGSDTIIHQIGTPFDDSKYVQVTDNYWTEMLPNRKSGSINANQQGSYTIVYQNTDGSGNISAEYKVVVVVKNNIMPTISLVGSAVVIVPVYGSYNDLGVVAKDYKGEILPYASDLNDVLRMDTIGDYIITYSASDGDNTVYVQRTVKVRDLESPVIELLGANPFAMGWCEAYVDPGVKVTDNFDPSHVGQYSKLDGTGLQITIDSSKANPCGAGFYYTVYVNATDASGNKAEEKKRIVYVSFNGLSDVSKSNGFSVYPNPANNFINVQLNTGELQSITALDVQGKAITLNPVKDANGFRMDITNLNAGIYLLQLIATDGNTYSGKFTVTR